MPVVCKHPSHQTDLLRVPHVLKEFHASSTQNCWASLRAKMHTNLHFQGGSIANWRKLVHHSWSSHRGNRRLIITVIYGLGRVPSSRLQFLASTPEHNKDLESRELKTASVGKNTRDIIVLHWNWNLWTQLGSLVEPIIFGGLRHQQDLRNSNLERATTETLKWRDTRGQSTCGESNLKIQLFGNNDKPPYSPYTISPSFPWKRNLKTWVGSWQ